MTQIPPPLSPGSREEADVRRVKDLYNGLQLGMGLRRQRDFLALTRAWLLRYSTVHRLPFPAHLGLTNFEVDVIVDDAVLAFLFSLGERLWPSLDQPALRVHLQEHAWLQYVVDMARDAVHDADCELETGRPPRYYGERFLCSPLRQALRLYFYQVSRMVYGVIGGEREGKSIDGLFAKVVEGNAETVGMGTLEEWGVLSLPHQYNAVVRHSPRSDEN
ncbi:hypothetical protein LTR91_015209 [Friedmanniomyces endolithicus]|uniref:Uncharacterized protein n=2 Tax=Dothideomycetidae TaxID=451867 RepID=A0A4U0VGS0_9PEZI|nr:hypothetical protein LTR94_006461 [Friedmanniomyces endolithicus]KAK5144025.1 hypothetical protein LTR32_003973 [Rachicladosporium monterosium]KAK0785149.1 hypothetical protein LTR59_011118 [Friedmanniomyces endolithicus]KAK0814552.1 hypothetical protein LTR75_004260 [Friedmanniomyces endolithicus]KAK0850587.1 hypothetical protein LTR03_004559 [Friedmanniomyces endolithicus]